MAVSTQIFTAEIPAFSRSQSCLTYFNFILNISNIKINRSRRYLPNPTYVRLKRDVTRVIRFLAPTFRRLLFKLNSSCLRFPSCRFRSLDGMANLFFCGISQVNITIDRHYDYQLHLPHESCLFCPILKMGMVWNLKPYPAPVACCDVWTANCPE